jgi:HSP20 family molecular chaperone IbpA
MYDLFPKDWLDFFDFGGHYDYEGVRRRRQAAERRSNWTNVTVTTNSADIASQTSIGHTVTADKDGLTITIDVPGVRVEDVTIEHERQLLTVSWKRNDQQKTLSWSVNESYDLERSIAKVELGVLTIRAPTKAKAPEPAKRKVLVQGG